MGVKNEVVAMNKKQGQQARKGIKCGLCNMASEPLLGDQPCGPPWRWATHSGAPDGGRWLRAVTGTAAAGGLQAEIAGTGGGGGSKQIPGAKGYVGCHRCGSKEHRAINCKVEQQEKIGPTIRKRLKQDGEEATRVWLLQVLDHNV